MHPPPSGPSSPAGRRVQPRLDLIRRVRGEIERGSYDTDQKLAIAVDRMLDRALRGERTGAEMAAAV